MFVFLCFAVWGSVREKMYFLQTLIAHFVQIRKLLIVVRLRRGCRVLPGCTKVDLGLHSTL